MTYFKRYRMEVGLDRPFPSPRLPEGFSWHPWHDSLIDRHAEVKYECFRDETDAQVFPNLGCPTGCRELMRIIRYLDGFVPQATWLLVGPDGGVGTVQGVSDCRIYGAIQNLGVVPAFRGQGLGEALLLKALHGFQRIGLRRAYLEVTADNAAAVDLYRKHGFRNYRTLYKSVEATAPSPVGMGL